MTDIQPLGPYLSVELLPEEPQSSTLVLPAGDTVVRWCKVLAVGPQVRDIQAGQEVAVSTNQGVCCGGVLLLPFSSVLLTRN